MNHCAKCPVAEGAASGAVTVRALSPDLQGACGIRKHVSIEQTLTSKIYLWNFMDTICNIYDIYIYTRIERERDREREGRCVCVCVSLSLCQPLSKRTSVGAVLGGCWHLRMASGFGLINSWKSCTVADKRDGTCGLRRKTCEENYRQGSEEHQRWTWKTWRVHASGICSSMFLGNPWVMNCLEIRMTQGQLSHTKSSPAQVASFSRK